MPVLSIFLPDWPIDRVRRQHRRGGSRPDAAGPPHVLLTRIERDRPVIARAGRRACAVGVQPGMTLDHARAVLTAGDRNADICVQLWNPDADANALVALARWCRRWSPTTAADRPDGVLIDLAGCRRYHRGLDRLTRHVDTALNRLALRHRLALAPNPGCAWALARFHHRPPLISEPRTPDQLADLLGPLPTAALRTDSATSNALAEVGLDTVADLLAIDRGELAHRFGPELVRRIDQALGRMAEPVSPVAPVSPLQKRMAFDGPTRRPATIEAAGRRLLEDLCHALAPRGHGIRTLALTLDRGDHPPATEIFRLTRPRRDPRALWTLMSDRVGRMHLGEGVDAVELAVRATEPLPHQQDHWWSRADHPSDDDGLLDRLAERVGPRRVERVARRPTHVPEAVFQRQSATDNPAGQTGSDPPPRPPVDRPSRLFRPLRPIQARTAGPEGPVLSFTVDRHPHLVDRTLGPEPIACRWWQFARADAEPATRHYFTVRSEDGRWWWLC
ncbi:MAG: DNA polymerase Y family protein, partial [Phycisphaeraceae bacterium]|nr:DNA polymerase Y family protein [Phycisphaeraceae bacterium]